MRFFSGKEMVFYFLPAKECDRENLEDFLEEKICKILNLKMDCEYFLRYFEIQNNFYCLLLNKEVLQGYTQDFEDFLTHPVFFTSQMLNANKEYQFFIVENTFCGTEFMLIGYFKDKMIYLQQFNALEDAMARMMEFSQNYPNAAFYFWSLDKNNEKEFQKYSSKIEILEQSWESLTLEEQFNFNPIQKEIPLRKQRVSKLLSFMAVGGICGVFYPLLLFAWALWEGENCKNLQEQIKKQKDTQQLQVQNYSALQKEILALEQKHQKLQEVFAQNEAFLQRFLLTSPRISSFFEQISSYLQIQDVKIAYFHANKNIFEFLLVGEGSAEFLRILEQEKLGKLEVIQAIDSFYFVRIAV
ncbi:hypothetical protein HPU229336_01730 [Helicobacter pullorum]|uniref:Transmembrane protein n=2 Tax=Helicobacter pullorum TaxID=35818 RepID=A0AAW3J5I4_9HELI|nr:hypothetical protein HPU229336_01730 [Helicobacter pullorum]